MSIGNGEIIIRHHGVTQGVTGKWLSASFLAYSLIVACFKEKSLGGL